MRMKHAGWVAALALVLGVHGYMAWSAQAPVAPAELAACLVKNVGEERLHAIGESLALTKSPQLRRGDAIACDGGVRFALSEDVRKSVEAPLLALLPGNATARQALYGFTQGTELSPVQRKALGEVGGFFDSARRAALQGASCQSVDGQAATFVQQLDLPFAIASVGIHVGVGDPAAAQELAQKLLTRVDAVVAATAGPVDCKKDNGAKAFKAYAAQMHRFYKTEHPWAPGCGVRQDNEGFVLVCSGSKP